MKYLILFAFTFCLVTTNFAQNIVFSLTVEHTSTSTSVIKIFAQNNSGTENMAGFTTNFYYDNTETTLTSFDFSPATTLGWDVSASNTSFVANNNPSVTTTHTGYGTINVIDQNIVGTEVTSTAVHILTINFDHTVGNATQGGEGFLAATANNHPALEYVGNDFLGHPVLITGSQSQLLSQSSLPVELNNFKASATGERKVKLEWETLSERNNDLFEIEHSMNGIDFKVIGMEFGRNNSNALQSYESWDEQPQIGRNYYRLKQIDFDGTYQYSEIRVVEFKTRHPQTSVYPNPSSDCINIAFYDLVKEGRLLLIDEVGRLVLEQKIAGGNSVEQLQVSFLPKGIYWLQIESDGLTQNQKVVLQ